VHLADCSTVVSQAWSHASILLLAGNNPVDKAVVNILYISQYFSPEPCAPAARVHELSRAWVQAGASVSVLTAFPNHPTGIIPGQYRGRRYQCEMVDGIRVHRAYIYPAANKGFWGRIINYLSFAVSALCIGIFKLESPDVVVATSPQFLVALSGYVLARILRAPFVFEVRDLWPASITAVGALREGSILIRMLEALEVYLYRHAHHIVVVTDSFKRTIAAQGIPEAKISVSKNGVNLSFFHPGPKPQEILRRYGLEGKFVVSYIGTVGMAHGVELIVAAAERMQNTPDLHFVVVGQGAESAALTARASSKNLRNITFLGAVSRSEVREWIQASDVCTAMLRDRALFRTVIPSKLFEIMACARPVILAVAGEAARLLNKAGAGIAVQPENTDQFCAAILFLKENPGALETMGNRGRLFVEEHFDRTAQANGYLALLAGLRPAGTPAQHRAPLAFPPQRHSDISSNI
jgi:glycosyltransferase involved in cell wall biosynthesis